MGPTLPVAPATLLAFSALVLGLVLTPGPNMIHLASRSLSQGWRAGAVALGGTLLGFMVYMLLAAFGVTAVALAVPYAYDALRLAGAIYLGWLAWAAFRPGGAAPFSPRALPPEGARRLVVMGLVTNLLNPKVALFYAALLPQFVDPARGAVLPQLLTLGAVQIAISGSVNLALVLGAGRVAAFLAGHPFWERVQRRLMGLVLGGLALRLALDARR